MGPSGRRSSAAPATDAPPPPVAHTPEAVVGSSCTSLLPEGVAGVWVANCPQMDTWPQVSNSGKKLLPLTVKKDAPTSGHAH